MNKAELIDRVAVGADISRLAAEQVINSFITHIINTVSINGVVQLIGLGSFSQIERSARNGRNPVTGATVNIPATKSIKFRAGTAFKNTVNHKKWAFFAIFNDFEKAYFRISNDPYR